MSESRLTFHHAAITTLDLERLLEFYTVLLGGALVRRMSWEAGDGEFNERIGLVVGSGEIAIVEFGDVCLEIFRLSRPRTLPRADTPSLASVGLTHLCFRVENCFAEFERLSAAGMAFHAPPLLMPTGAAFTYGRDPDGNIVELLELPAAARFPGDNGCDAT